MSTPVKAQAAFTDCRTLRDGTLVLRFETQELPAHEMTALFQMRNQVGWLFFSPEEAPKFEFPEIQENAQENKLDKRSHSQKLRGAIYYLWQRMGSQGSFEVFYQAKMTMLVGQIGSE